jgi:hypothetical protein
VANIRHTLARERASVNRRIELLCAWCGPAFSVALVVGLWFVAGLIPPPSPSDSAEHIAAFYRANAGQVRLGMLICMLGSVLLAPFVALISRQIRRSSPRLELLADVQLICGVIGIVILLLSELLLATIAFRPDMSAQVLRALNDLGWTTLLWPFSPFSLEYAAVGIAVLMDPREQPLHPRWVGLVSLLVAVLFAFGGPTLWVMHGAFSWDGLLTLWVVFGSFGLWVSVMCWSMIRAIAHEEKDHEGNDHEGNDHEGNAHEEK